MAKRGPYRHRTLEERLKAHSQVTELWATGKTVKEIAEALDISRRDVSYWFRVRKPSRTVYSPDLTPRDELAYLVGAYLGDGRTAGEQDKKVRFKVADPTFADQLNDLISTIIGASRKPVAFEEGFSCVSYDSAGLYDYLQQPLSALQPLIDISPTMFLRGFFDAEGYASPRLNHSKKHILGILLGVANTNSEYLDCVQLQLNRLGIRASRFKTHDAGEPMTIRGNTFHRKKEVRQVQLRGKNVAEVFQARINFSIPVKKTKLADLIWISRSLSTADGYNWFVSHYELRNKRWVRNMHANPSPQ